MAVVFMDGMAHYTTADLAEKYTTVSVGPTTGTDWAIVAEGRFANCIRRTALDNFGPGYLDISPLQTQTNYWTPTTSGVIGFAIKIDDCSKAESGVTGSGCQLISIREGSRFHLALALQTDGTLLLLRSDASVNPPQLVFSGEALTNDTWYYLEMKWVLDNAPNGYCEVRINGIPRIVFTGDTSSNGYPVPFIGIWTAVRLLEAWSTAGPSPYLTIRICDLYLADLSGSVNNDFLGDITVDYIKPNDVGASSAWTVLTGPANYQDVDEQTPDDDTTYIYGTSPGLRDLYEMEDVTGDPLAIQLVAFARKETEGTAQLRPSLRSGGSTYDGLAQGVADTAYTYLTWPYDTNPDTGARFTEAEMDALQAGILKQV